jgi:hypothetical protein
MTSASNWCFSTSIMEKAASGRGVADKVPEAWPASPTVSRCCV